MNLEELKARNIHAPVRQSSVSCAFACRRKFLYRYIWGLIPKVEQYKKAATIGRLFHRFLQLGPEDVDKVKAEVQTDQKALMAQVDAGEDLTGDLLRTAQNLTDLYNTAHAMAEIFWRRHPRPARLQSAAKELEIEMEFEGIKLAGRVDEIVFNMETKDYWIRDAKTTSDSLALALSGYQWGIQARLYRLLVDHWLKTDPIPQRIETPIVLRGLILDIAQVPGIKYCAKDKSFEDYIKRVEKWYDDKGEQGMTAKGIVFTEPLVPEELYRAIDAIRRLSAPGANCDRDPTGQACKGFKKRCQYYELCASDETMWPSIIQKDFNVLDIESKGDETDVESE